MRGGGRCDRCEISSHKTHDIICLIPHLAGQAICLELYRHPSFQESRGSLRDSANLKCLTIGQATVGQYYTVWRSLVRTLGLNYIAGRLLSYTMLLVRMLRIYVYVLHLQIEQRNPHDGFSDDCKANTLKEKSEVFQMDRWCWCITRPLVEDQGFCWKGIPLVTM